MCGKCLKEGTQLFDFTKPKKNNFVISKPIDSFIFKVYIVEEFLKFTYFISANNKHNVVVLIVNNNNNQLFFQFFVEMLNRLNIDLWIVNIASLQGFKF
jgi:hypothetical protein